METGMSDEPEGADAAAVARLAVVDDSDEFRAFVRAVAGPMGWEVTEFANGRDLFAALAEGLRPGLIMLDMVMPEMDGIETIDALGTVAVRCPVILMTGRLPVYTQTADQLSRAHGIEIREILHKPVKLTRLRAALNRDAPAAGG